MQVAGGGASAGLTTHTVPWLNSSVTLLVSKAPLKKRLFLSGLDIPF